MSVMFKDHSMSFYRILITFLTFTVCVNLDGIPFIYFCFMTRHQQERYSGQVLSLLTFIIKNESPRHVALRHRIRIGELQLSWQNRPAGYSRLSIPPDWCLSYLQCRFGHISTISFLYISFTLVLCFLCVYYYKLKGRCTLSFVMYRYWF